VILDPDIFPQIRLSRVTLDLGTFVPGRHCARKTFVPGDICPRRYLSKETLVPREICPRMTLSQKTFIPGYFSPRVTFPQERHISYIYIDGFLLFISWDKNALQQMSPWEKCLLGKIYPGKNVQNPSS
jgi:hypothetical protein